jgi:MFS family permease
MSAGSFVGALVAGVLSDKIGRKETILIAAICWIIGSILMCAAQNLGMLIVGRIINGFAVGGASMVVPVYQSEIAPRNIRGRIVSFQQWAITWGILIQVSLRKKHWHAKKKKIGTSLTDFIPLLFSTSSNMVALMSPALTLVTLLSSVSHGVSK